jgi:hypothetical protein
LAAQLSSTLMDGSAHHYFELVHILMTVQWDRSTIMQLLFSFDSGIRVEKTLMQTLASQRLSLTLMQLYSCSRLTAAWELRKLSCKLSLLNGSHQLAHATTLVLVWQRHESNDWNSHANSRFSMALIDSHATILLFSFDSGMRVEKTLMQTLTSQLAHSRLTRAHLYTFARLLW